MRYFDQLFIVSEARVTHSTNHSLLTLVTQTMKFSPATSKMNNLFLSYTLFLFVLDFIHVNMYNFCFNNSNFNVFNCENTNRLCVIRFYTSKLFLGMILMQIFPGNKHSINGPNYAIFHLKNLLYTA